MKRALISVVLFAACSDRENVNPSAEAESGLSMPACGAALASFDGTTAYSNGADTSSGYSCAGQGAYGYRYQCVELVMRHFMTHWGLRWYGNARDLLNYAPRDTVDVFYNGDAAHPPVPGDMVVWQVGTYGHVALVTAVSSTQVAVLEQNVVGNGTALLPYDGARIGARWTNWVPAGWAHAKANGTPPPPASWNCADSAWGGSQLWTCSGGALHECDAGGAAVTQSCDHGCYARSAGEDDLCISNVSGWNCANSAYAGQQYWTCSSGSIYRCENGVQEVVRCPSGCAVHALGTNDACY